MLRVSQRTSIGGVHNRTKNSNWRSAGDSFQAGFHYSSFTAADEKVPLSVAQVKHEPLYLVSSWLFREPKPKTLRFCLWKARFHLTGVSCAVPDRRIATLSGRFSHRFATFQPGIRTRRSIFRLCLHAAGNKAQKPCKRPFPLCINPPECANCGERDPLLLRS